MKISTLTYFQALSGASKLQQSSCNTSHDVHLGINRNTKKN